MLADQIKTRVSVEPLSSSYLRSIANCWQWAESTILLTSEFAASLISDHGLHSDICSSRIDTAQKACRLYLTWLDTANLTSVDKVGRDEIHEKGVNLAWIDLNNMNWLKTSFLSSANGFVIQERVITSWTSWFIVELNKSIHDKVDGECHCNQRGLTRI